MYYFCSISLLSDYGYYKVENYAIRTTTNINTISRPFLANHPLGSEETKMAKNVASLPFVFKHVAIMPDVHLGKEAIMPE